MLKRLLIILFFFVCFSAFAQEFDCKVSVLYPKVQTTNKEVFTNLETAVSEFINTRKWTEHIYREGERIECSMVFVIDEWNEPLFSGSLQIQASRPVFNSNYKTTMLNYKDKDISFEYSEFETLELNENVRPENLVAIVSFYAYLILGFDYDSFSLNGGVEFFRKADNIVTQMQFSSQTGGWLSYQNTRNRYWISENLRNPAYKAFHECMYLYHLQGLDVMHEEVEKGRGKIQNGLFLLEKVHEAQPGTPLLQFFFDAKADEVINIFAESEDKEKSNMHLYLSEIDPGNISKYKKLNIENRQRSTR